MRHAVPALLLMVCMTGVSVASDDSNRSTYGSEFFVRSLNAPDPVFIPTGSNVEISVSTKSRSAIDRAVIKLNGRDVTASLASWSSTELRGTVTSLKPGLNTLEVFESHKARTASASLKVARAKGPSMPCALEAFSGIKLPIPNTVITAVTPVAPTSAVPAHCLLTGTIDASRVGYESSPGAPVSVYTYAIKWAARLPDAWNSKFFMPGGGGSNGSIPSTTANLILGYAIAASDSGHDNDVNYDPFAAGTGSFGTDYGARRNFSHRAIDATTRTARTLIAAYYRERPRYSYFQGCSMGGREAMMVTQYFPNYFDGVIAADPAFKFTGVTVRDVYNAQVLAKLATRMGLVSATGLPLVNNTFTNQDLQLVSKAVLDACDNFDGLPDGMVSNFHRCTTPVVMSKLNALHCRGAKSAHCLLPEQIDTIEKLYGPVPASKPNGKPMYHG
jgi:hypothetical protein